MAKASKYIFQSNKPASQPRRGAFGAAVIAAKLKAKICKQREFLQRTMALFFVLILVLQSTVVVAATPGMATAASEPSIAKKQSGEEMAQLNTDYKDSRAKDGNLASQPEGLKSTNTSSTKAQSLASVENIIKEQAPKYTLKKTDPENTPVKREKIEKRNATTNVYETTTGGEVIKQGAIDQNYKDSSGNWQKIDFSSRKDPEYTNRTKQSRNFLQNTWDFLTQQNSQPESFRSDGGSIRADFQTLSVGGIQYRSDAGSFSIQPEGAGIVKPEYIAEKNSTKIKYSNVWDGIDLYYEYRGTTIKEYIVINKKPKTNQLKFKVEGTTVINVNNKVETTGNLAGKFSFGDLSVSVRNKGILSEPLAKQTASSDGKYIVVDLDQAWLSSQKNDSYPIVIDPTVAPNSGIPGGYTGNFWPYKSDGYVGSSQTSNVNVGGLYSNGAGSGIWGWRTMVQLPYFQLAADQKLVDSQIYMEMMPDSAAWWHGYKENHTIYASYANCFGYSCVGNPGADGSIQGIVGTYGSINTMPLMNTLMDPKQPYGTGAVLMLRGEEWLGYSWKEINPLSVFLITVTNRIPTQISPLLPSIDANTEVVSTSATPQLAVTTSTDGDATDAVKYSFRVLGSNGQQLWESGLQSSPSVVVPEGVLEDGSSYSWKARVSDGTESGTQPEIAGGKIRVTNRSGKDKTQTYDSLGPVSANLASGNVTTSLSTHTISALGGNIGLSLTYNSPVLSRYGLDAEYYNNTNWSGSPVYRRNDPNINFKWAGGSPVPGVVGNDNFSVKHSGYFVAPYDGNFTFGSTPDDTTRINVGGVDVLNGTYCASCGVQWAASPVAMKSGEIKKLEVYSNEGTGAAVAQLYVKSATDTAGRIVPSEWLRTAPQARKTNAGLKAHYYSDDGSHDFSKNTNRFMSRVESQVDNTWGTSAPVPNAQADNFMARWEGYFTAPTTGTYKFGAAADDGVRLSVNGNRVVDKWQAGDSGTNYAASSISLNAGQSVPIQMEYFEVSGNAYAKLLYDGPNGIGVIPSAHLSSGVQVLPEGWELSADADGNLAYERLNIRTNGDVGVYDSDGSERVFTTTGTGYKPPVNEDAILNRNSDGSFTLVDSDGRNYGFNSDGTLAFTTTPPDYRNPAALRYEYSTQNGVPKLTKIVDGVDPSRFAALMYYGEPGCSGSPAGFDGEGPKGMLCAFRSYDAQKTNVLYKNGKLARLQMPGNANYDLGYNTTGMLSSMRDSLANDAIAAKLRTNDEKLTTELQYDELARLQNITSVAPSAELSRTRHSFEYLAGSTKQHIFDAPEPKGYMQSIEYDALGRTTKQCSNRASCSTTEYHASKDLVLSTTDALGYKSTNIYDSNDVVTHSYGPAPAAWYGADRVPLNAYYTLVPHSEQRYDEGIFGPAVSYYNYKKITTTAGENGVLFGAPKVHTNGINSAPALFKQTWNTPPASVDSGMDGWAMNATGRLSVPVSGTYTITLKNNDGVKLWIDDVAVVDDWKSGATRNKTYQFSAIAGTSYRFSLQYFDLTDSTNANIELSITNPAGATTSDIYQYLKPAYYLKTSSLAHDATAGTVVAKTQFTNPALGQATSSILDPTGLALSSTASYESPGSGYLRQTSKTLAGGEKYTYQYYGASDKADDPCTTTVESYKQAGMLKGKTSPAGISSTLIYDAAGRVVAAKTNNDAWSCTTYDARGRATKVVVPTINGRVGRTVETFYSYGGNPFVTAINDTKGGLTLAEVDLMGRTVRSVDGYLNETKSAYNNLGQVTKRTSPLGLEEFTYDSYGVVSKSTLDGVEYAKSTYDGYGRIANVKYLDATNGTTSAQLKSVSYDTLGRSNGTTFVLPDATSLITTDTLSASNRITKNTITFAGKTATSDYTYDKAGRLATAKVDNYQFGYDYSTNSSYCASKPSLAANLNQLSGLSSNRTRATTLNTTTNESVVQENCYGKNGRLLQSSDVQVDKPEYDDHGNTTYLGGDGKAILLGYDASDRNTVMSQDGYKIKYTRSAEGSIIAKNIYVDNVLTEAYRYYAGGSVVATCNIATPTQCSVSERTVSLAGNVSLTLRNNQPNPELARTYNVKNSKGESVLSFTSNGKPIGSINLYDPFGGQLYSNTFNKIEDLVVSSEKQLSLGIAQYGKRLYIASLGRFLQADPVEGGTPNEYTYVVDPVNSNDFSGEWGWGNITSFVSNAWNQTVNAVSNAVRAVTTFVTENIIKPIIHVAQTTYRAVKHVVKQVARAAVQVAKTVVNYAYIAAQRIQQAVQVAAATASAIANRIAQAYNDKIKPYADLGYVVEQFGQSYARREQYRQNLKTFNEVANFLLGPAGGLGVQTIQNLAFSTFDCVASIMQECIQSIGTGSIDLIGTLLPFGKVGTAVRIGSARELANISGAIDTYNAGQIATSLNKFTTANNLTTYLAAFKNTEQAIVSSRFFSGEIEAVAAANAARSVGETIEPGTNSFKVIWHSALNNQEMTSLINKANSLKANGPNMATDIPIMGAGTFKPQNVYGSEWTKFELEVFPQGTGGYQIHYEFNNLTNAVEQIKITHY